MAQAPKNDHQQQRHYNENDEIADLQLELEYNGFYGQVYRMTKQFATSQVGQVVIERCDRVLRYVEETAKWSLPQKYVEDKLVRPFNWIFFLAFTVTLRLIRIGLSFCAIIVGNSPVTIHDIVYFIQTFRRKLQAIRLHGLKELQRREVEESSDTHFGGFTAKIMALLSIAICRQGKHHDIKTSRRIFIHQDFMKDCVTQKDFQACKRHREDYNSDLNLTFNQILSKYADENSEDDPDYEPSPEEESSNNSTSGESGNSDAEDQEDLENRNIQLLSSVLDSSSLKKKSQLNESVEISENGKVEMEIHYCLMPKPFIDIKREPLSGTGIGSEQHPSSNVAIGDGNRGIMTQKNGATNQMVKENLLPVNSTNNLIVHRDEVNKSTPGHESAAMMNPVNIPALNDISTVAHSIPKSPEDILELPTNACNKSSSPKTHVQHQQPQRNTSRGKNRR